MSILKRASQRRADFFRTGRPIAAAIRPDDGRLSGGRGPRRSAGTTLFAALRLIETLRTRDLAEAVARIEQAGGLAHRPSAVGDHVVGLYRERVTLSSGRFAMIDNGLGFQLVPWRPGYRAARAPDRWGDGTRGDSRLESRSRKRNWSMRLGLPCCQNGYPR